MIILSTDSLKWYGLHRAFLIAKKSWFDWVDLSIDLSNFDTLDLDYIKKLSEEIWIKVLSITAPWDKITEELVDKILAIWASLETKVITFFPPHFADKDISWYKEYLPKIKKSENLSIAIENVEAKFLFFIIPARKNSSLIEIKKITWDTSFNLSNSEDITKDANFLWDSIKNIYLSDTIWEKKWLLLGTSAWETSNLPIESLLMKLKANHYDWLFTIKINPNELWVWDEEKVIKNLKFCIWYIEKYF